MAHTMTIPSRADFQEMAKEAMQKEMKDFNFEITKLWDIYRKLQPGNRKVCPDLWA